ncbi:tetratricopeptide repeat protein [Pseudomonas koreensis]|uniref:tetratricopeptide repeat protein n=1 Tax=Pseudomonas koreensis TaxID=198620 RepID=UPI0021C582A5|nr:tetratricopeptide repeat protein [Pseudomonas koreensis]MCU0072519.1 tetratricopeptide repeat protein [Pseudomonas koreensis]
MSYFSRKNTSGSFASDGFRYQDGCALLHAVKNLLNNDFKSIGIETEDDFCLLFGSTRINVQVKDSELNFPLIKSHLADNQILIGSSMKKEVETFITYLTHYRNAQASGETDDKKFEISQDFAELLQKHELDNIPPSWTPLHHPRAGLYDCIAVNIHSIARSRQQIVDADACIARMLHLFANARCDRNHLGKNQLLGVISEFSADVQIVKSNYARFETPIAQKVIQSVGGNTARLLDKVAEKIHYADTLQKKGRYADALTIYTSLSMFLETDEIFLACAMLHDVLDNVEAAKSSAIEALDCNPRCFGAHFILGTLAQAQGDRTGTLNHFESAYAIDSSNPVLLYNLGVYWQTHDRPKAMAFYEQSLRSDNDNSSAHLNYGICLFLNGDYSDALHHIDQALLLEPGAPSALAQKGEIQRFFGNHAEAIDSFERALKKDRDNVPSLEGIAYCRLALGDTSGVGLLIDYLEEKLSSLRVGERLKVEDMGWNSTNVIVLERCNKQQLKFHYNDMVATVYWPNNDKIGLGTYQVDEIMLPLILKDYDCSEHYQEALRLISLTSIEAPEPTRGSIRERSDCCEIALKVNAFTLSGNTPRINGGYESFREHYHGVYLLMLRDMQGNNASTFRLRGIEFF